MTVCPMRTCECCDNLRPLAANGASFTSSYRHSCSMLHETAVPMQDSMTRQLFNYLQYTPTNGLWIKCYKQGSYSLSSLQYIARKPSISVIEVIPAKQVSAEPLLAFILCHDSVYAYSLSAERASVKSCMYGTTHDEAAADATGP